MPKIVVIDDEAAIRDEVVDWLHFEGYEAIGAANGRSGLDAIHQSIPDLVLCDIAMPEINGHEVLIELRSHVRTSQIPFIFLTASVDRDAVRQGMNLGADDYLTKPFTHADVLTAVRTRLDKQAIVDRQTQQQLDAIGIALTQEREKHLLKSRILAMFSHDFRNPLSAILSSSNLLRDYADQLSPDRKKRQYDRIDGAVFLLIQMLDEMLLAAESESGKLAFTPQAVDLTSFCKELIEEFQLIDSNHHRFAFHSTVHTPAQADPKLLRQILANLISNALKYSPADSEISIKLMEKAGKLMLIVQDQGIGIPSESLPHLFEAFHRAENARDVRGTGLGLSIVKHCIDHHQGSIHVQSQLGVGTIFTVEIPRV